MKKKLTKQKKSLGAELIESVTEAIHNPSSVKTVRTGIDIKQVRKNLNMTQKVFAYTYGFGLETVRKWEQGINSPDKSVISYLLCIQKAPKVISKLIGAELKKQG